MKQAHSSPALKALTVASIFLLVMTLVLVPGSQGQLINTKIAFVSNRDGNLEVYIMDVDGTNPINLTNHPANDGDGGVEWSPDGTRIAFSSDRDGNAEIYMMDADGTNHIRLTNHPASDRAPTWSPDSARMAFESERDGNAEIYVMDAAGTNLVNLTNHPANDYDPAWSPDGTKIVFRSNRSGFCCKLYIMNADGTNQTQLTGTDDDGAAWSPDGTKIAFRSDRQRNSNGDICVINPDGTGLQCVDHLANDSGPSWSPDGTKIVFATNRDGNFEIYVMDAEPLGANVTRLTNHPAHDAGPAWSPFLVITVPRPVCDIRLNKATFVKGDQVIAQVLRIANLAATPLAIEFKFWFEVPGLGLFSFARGGADGSVVLPPAFDLNVGPVTLFTVQAGFPRGTWGFHCRLVHPVTGGLQAEDLNPFTIQ